MIGALRRRKFKKLHVYKTEKLILCLWKLDSNVVMILNIQTGQGKQCRPQIRRPKYSDRSGQMV